MFNKCPIGGRNLVYFKFNGILIRFNKYPMGDEIFSSQGINCSSLTNPIGDETSDVHAIRLGCVTV